MKKGFTTAGTIWAFSITDATYGTYWHPLTWLSHMLDVELFGLDAGKHHMTNALIHIATVILLFLLLYRTTSAIWKSACVAALFAVHPINVDSVAWIAERKNLLSAFFWMLTMLAYTSYVRKASLPKYFLVVLCFSLGLLAKPTIAVLPFVLLLFDFWPLKRFRMSSSGMEPNHQAQLWNKNGNIFLFVEKSPFFVLGAVAILLSSLSLRNAGNLISTSDVSMGLRIQNALVSYVAYLGKLLWPADLSVYYPFPEAIPMWKSTVAALFLVFVFLFVINFRKSHPYLATGWFWFFGSLVPVSGLMQGGLWPEMADRWAYMPAIGFYLIIIWGSADLLGRLPYPKTLCVFLLTSMLCVLSVKTWTQVQYWKDDFNLFSHAIHVNSSNFVGHNNLGLAYMKRGEIEEAIGQYTEALGVRPNYPIAHYNLGIALVKQNKMDEAIFHFEKALQNTVKASEVYNNMGLIYETNGDFGSAALYYRKALDIDSENSEAHNNLGVVLQKEQRLDEAIGHYREALRINPDHAEAHNNLGVALESQGQLDAAILHYQGAIQIRPNNTKAYVNLARIFLAKNQADKAISLYRKALSLGPLDAAIHNNLGAALMRAGNRDEAIDHFRSALKIRPDYDMAAKNLEKALADNDTLK